MKIVSGLAPYLGRKLWAIPTSRLSLVLVSRLLVFTLFKGDLFLFISVLTAFESSAPHRVNAWIVFGPY